MAQSDPNGAAPGAVAAQPETLHLLWLNAGLSCDGDSVALTAAMRPSVEDLALGAIPGIPPVAFHWPLLAWENGEEFLATFHAAANGELDDYLLVVEGSIPNEEILEEGWWAAFGTDAETGQPITTSDWVDRLAPNAWAVVAVGTCATYGGIHGMQGNPTGAMGLPDHLGWAWTSAAGVPIVCVPGCPVQPDNLAEVLLYLLQQRMGQAPRIPLDEALRPTWLFQGTAHEGCDRAGHYEQGTFASRLGEDTCIVRQGCWGPVVLCNVPKRGWMNGVGGCPNVGGICIGCTMPGFPDRFQPFMDEPPGGKMSSAISSLYGGAVRRLREFTVPALDQEPSWRRPGPLLTTGYRAPDPAEDDR